MIIATYTESKKPSNILMDALKLIPQLFYDIIARIVPGALLIVALNYSIERNIIRIVVDALMIDFKLSESAFVWSLILFSSAYLIGNLIASFIRFIEKDDHSKLLSLIKFLPFTKKLNKSLVSNIPMLAKGIKWLLKAKYLPFTKSRPKGEMVLKEIQAGSNSTYPPHVVNFLKTEIGQAQDSHYRSIIFIWYDWLRTKYPADGGALTAKIRAEYTMCGGIAATIIVALALNGLTVGAKWLFFDQKIVLAHRLLLIISALLIPVMLNRHKYVFGIFQLSVINLYFVGKDLLKTGTTNDPPTSVVCYVANSGEWQVLYRYHTDKSPEK